MTESCTCESCGMTIESGPYCQYCVDDDGNLQAFDERFARMTQFLKRRDPSLSEADLRAQTLDYMATMPAWREHPTVVARGAAG